MTVIVIFVLSHHLYQVNTETSGPQSHTVGGIMFCFQLSKPLTEGINCSIELIQFIGSGLIFWVFSATILLRLVTLLPK